MAHVFISYSSQHRDLTEKLAGFFEDCGLEVWWDRELHSRRDFDWQIHEELRAAGCVVVLWTAGAVASEWVLKEAAYARDHDRLICARADDLPPTSIPECFRKRDAHKLDTERTLILRDVLAVREGRLLLEDNREELPPPDQRTPTMLLQGKFGLVPFTGSMVVREDLLDWTLSRGKYTGAGRRSAGRLIHGAGGLGKSRLLIEVAEALRAEGWSAGFLVRPGAGDRAGDTAESRTARRARQTKALNHFIRGASDKGLLLVMDYAEGREQEIKDISAVIRSRPQDDARPIRLVLLTRGAGDWWFRLIEEDQVTRALFGGERPDVYPLEGITSGKDRHDLFLAAVDAFTPRLDEMDYTMPVDGELTRRLTECLERVETNAGYTPGDGYDRPLAIAIEALLCLAAMAPSPNEPGVPSLLANILGLERQHWHKLVGSLAPEGDRDPREEMERAVAQITGVQGVQSRRAAEDLLMRDCRYPDRRSNRGKVSVLTTKVGKVYGRGGIFAQLEPDLVGEHHVGLVADQELIDGCLAWIDSESDAAKRSELQRTLLTVLQRASRPEHGAAGVDRACVLLDHLIDNHGGTLGVAMVRVMGDTPGALVERLQTKVETLDASTLTAINFALPIMHVSWMEFSLRVAERCASLAMFSKSWAAQSGATETEDHDKLTCSAAAFDMLAIRLSNLGHRERSLAVSQEAVKIRRALANNHPNAFLPGLASSLNDLGIMLANLGRREEAFAASNEAVDIYRVLAKDRADDSFPHLAGSLTNLGSSLRALGRREEALAVSSEAVDIYRALAKDRPAAFLPNLAISLNNLSNRLSDLGRHEEALAASDEAVDIYRALAKDRPDTFLPDLAGNLNNLGIRHTKLGRREAAFAASYEGVGIYRALAEDRPDSFFPHLASSLNNLGRSLSALGRREEALAASNEAVDIYRALAKDQPSAFLPDLAMSLNNLGNWLSDLGRHEEALAVSSEAVDVYRALAKDRPDAFLPDLAMSLNTVGIMHSKLGHREKALAATKETVEIRRALASSHLDAFLPDFAMSLNDLGIMLSSLGRREEAFAASNEAVDIYRVLAKDRPEVAFPYLAGGLTNIGSRLSDLGRHEEALVASNEAVDIYRALAKDRPSAFLPDLAMSLNNLGSRLTNLRCREEAIAASREAVDIRRALVKDRPDAFLPDLASSLNNLGRSLSNLNVCEEALAVTKEAVDIYRALAKDRTDAFLPDLAMSLNNFGMMLSDVGRREEALTASREAVDIRRTLARHHPNAFLPNLAISLGALSHSLVGAQCFAEAAEVALEGLTVIAPFVEAQPQAFGDIARVLGNAHLVTSEEARREPNIALLQRVARVLGGGESKGENTQ